MIRWQIGTNMKTKLKTNMSKENIYLDFRIEKIDETRKYLLEEIKNVI